MDDAKSVFHDYQKFIKSDTFESDTIFVTFEIFGKCWVFDENNNNNQDLLVDVSALFWSQTLQ